MGRGKVVFKPSLTVTATRGLPGVLDVQPTCPAALVGEGDTFDEFGVAFKNLADLHRVVALA